MVFEEELIKISELITKSRHLVVFTGAGISTESGLSDYRGPDGVWTRRDKGLGPKPGPSVENVSPNRAHNAISKLQDYGFLKFLISQNVDNLHLRSGISSDLIAELHGNFSIMKCIRCDNRFTKDELNWDENKFGKGYRKQKPIIEQPECPACKGRIISSIVNFDDPMPIKEMNLATQHSRSADVFLVVGSSLLVQPAASLPLEAKENGAILIIINLGKTPLDKYADFLINFNAGEILENLVGIISQNVNKN